MSYESIIEEYDQGIQQIFDGDSINTTTTTGLYSTPNVGQYITDGAQDIIVVTGASCSGKDTLVSAITNIDNRIVRCKTATTRSWRGADHEPADAYIWIGQDWDPEMAKDPNVVAEYASEHRLLEYAINNPSKDGSGHLYGLPIDTIESAQRVIVDLYPSGLRAIQKIMIGNRSVRSVVTLTPQANMLLKRMEAGNRQSINDRMAHALDITREGLSLAEYVVVNADTPRNHKIRFNIIAERILTLLDNTQATQISEQQRKLDILEIKKPDNFVGLLPHEFKILTKLKGIYEKQRLIDAEQIRDANENSGGDWALDDDTVKASVESAHINELRMKDIPYWLESEAEISPKLPVANEIGFGSRVTIDWGDGDKEIFDIMTRIHPLFPIDEQSGVSGIISGASPLSEALMGNKVGDIVHFQASESKPIVSVKIESVDQEAQAKFYETYAQTVLK